TSQLCLEQTQGINASANSIDGDSSIAVYIDAGKRRIRPCRRKLDDWRKLESVSKIKYSARDYPVAFIDSCWSKLFWFELILGRYGNAVTAVRRCRLSSPSLRFRQDITCRKQCAVRAMAKSGDPAIVSGSICRREHIDLLHASCA